MPELPEVEVTRQGLLPYLSGRKVTKISYSGKKLRLPVPKKLLALHVQGDTIVTIDRRAKYLLFRMAGGSTMVIHLGMTGKLGHIPSEEPTARHDHLRLQLDTGMELRFNDTRRFGSVIVWPSSKAQQQEADFSDRIGVEPLSNNFTLTYLLLKSSKRKIPVKNFLMDSRIVAGIGNIYANEILFAASINPQTPAGGIHPAGWKAIISSSRRILKKAIRAGGSTISDFLGSSGNPGYFQVHFNVYNRTGEKCNNCSNNIQKIAIGGRATFFCPRCQPLKA